MNAIIREIEKEYLKDEKEFVVGNTLRVIMEVVEGDKKRLQAFEGIVVKRKGTGINRTVTIRKMVGTVGVEKVLPVHSPSLKKVEVIRRGKVRRAKLYYLRERVGKRARVKEALRTAKVTKEKAK